MEKFIDLCLDQLIAGVPRKPTIPLLSIPTWIDLELEYTQLCKMRARSLLKCATKREPFEAFHRLENIMKNRCQNVRCWDNSRVKLVKSNSHSATASDYIHAIYVDCFDDKRKFIATQAPILETLVDFFDMIWQNDCMMIVVLMNASEDNIANCYPYWVTEVESIMAIGQYTLETLEKEVKSHRVRYGVQLKNSIYPGKCHNINLYHYTDWPANGTPSNFDGLNGLIKEMNTFRCQCVQEKRAVGPIVVHGNEGVCRTVIFCTIDLCAIRWCRERRLRVAETLIYVHEMRYSKFMTLEQYIFLCRLLIEIIRPFFRQNN